MFACQSGAEAGRKPMGRNITVGRKVWPDVYLPIRTRSGKSGKFPENPDRKSGQKGRTERADRKGGQKGQTERADRKGGQKGRTDRADRKGGKGGGPEGGRKLKSPPRADKSSHDAEPTSRRPGR